MKDIFFELK